MGRCRCLQSCRRFFDQSGQSARIRKHPWSRLRGLLVLDGLGWNQFKDHQDNLRFLTEGSATAITTVAPSTTASALTSITTGVPPGEHGVIGYKISTHQGLLELSSLVRRGKSMIGELPPIEFQPVEPFLGTHPPAITCLISNHGVHSSSPPKRPVWVVVSSDLDDRNYRSS